VALRRRWRVMNGNARDQIDTDLKAGRPTISPVADPLALRVASLLSVTERLRLFERLEHRVRRSPAASAWAAVPPRHLSELDTAAASAIERQLAALHRRLVRRARQRGWEVSE
jgi:hypothetical protein